MTPERMHQLRRIGVTAGFGLLVFVVALFFSFPFDRIKDLVVSMGSSQGYTVEIGKAGPTFGIGVSFADIKVESPSANTKKPDRFIIENATVKVSPWAQILGKLAFSVNAETMGGEIDAEVESSKAKGLVKITTQKISLSELPGVRQAVNLPLGGSLDFGLDMLFPANKNATSSGIVSWKCAACVVGDGKEKLKVPGNPLLAEGISFPKIRLGDFVGRVAFEKGVGKLQGIQAKSPDVELFIEGEVRLADPAKYSALDLYVRFKLSDSLLKVNDNLKLMMQFTDAGKRPDGFVGFRLTGTFGGLGPVQWAKASPFGSGTAAGPSPRPSANRPTPTRPRPNVTAPVPVSDDNPVQPEKAVGAAWNGEPVVKTVDPATDPNANMPKYPVEPVRDPPPPPADSTTPTP